MGDTAGMSGLDWRRSPRGELATQGAHVLRWRPDGEDVLFVSPNSRFVPGVPIRGGVPIVFPWFGEDPAGLGRPAHGFARRLPWRLLLWDEDHATKAARAVLELTDDEATLQLWPHRFRAVFDVTLGDELSMSLSVENCGEAPFSFEALLHTYLRVADVRRCSLGGLEDAWCVDKGNGGVLAKEGTGPMRFAGECDRVFCGNDAVCTLRDPGLQRTLSVHKDGARSTVVWAPGEAKAMRLPDLGPSHLQFLCIESGNVGDDAVRLQPAESHAMRVRIECVPFGRGGLER